MFRGICSGILPKSPLFWRFELSSIYFSPIFPSRYIVVVQYGSLTRNASNLSKLEIIVVTPSANNL